MRIKDYAFVRLKEETWIKVNFNKIVYVKAGTNYAHMYFENGERVTYKSPLIKLQSQLPIYFERIHNSYIINVNYINLIDFNEKSVLLNNKTNISIGNAYKENIERYFLSTKNKSAV